MNETKPSQDETREAPLPEVRTMFRDADEAAIQDIEKRYGDLIPPNRLAEMRAHPTSFETDKEFRAHFAERLGEEPKDGMLGWAVAPTEATHVSTAELDSVPEIVYHERLHQAADPETARGVSSDWNEGMTQALTERATGIAHEGDVSLPTRKRPPARKVWRRSPDGIPSKSSISMGTRAACLVRKWNANPGIKRRAKKVQRFRGTRLRRRLGEGCDENQIRQLQPEHQLQPRRYAAGDLSR